eukprot:442092-Amphidinium_carterae.1
MADVPDLAVTIHSPSKSGRLASCASHEKCTWTWKEMEYSRARNHYNAITIAIKEEQQIDYNYSYLFGGSVPTAP